MEMRKHKIGVIGLVLVLLVLVPGVAVGSHPPPCYSCALGDANEDGVINVLDITTTELMAAGLRPPTFAADVNRDAKINDTDIALVIDLVANQ